MKAERSHLTGEISRIRKDIKTAEFTLDRSEKVRSDIKTELGYCKGDKHRSQKETAKTVVLTGDFELIRHRKGTLRHGPA